MTKRNTFHRILQHHLTPLEQALGCIVTERLMFMWTPRIVIGQVYAISLNRNGPVALRGTASLHLSVGQLCRVSEDSTVDNGPYRAQTVGYRYVISTSEGREILAFHWTPEADPSLATTLPHLHVGSVNISDSAPLAPKSFNKLHIPTGAVSLQSVVRFLIEEAGVEPRRVNWSEVLDQGQAQFTPRSR